MAPQHRSWLPVILWMALIFLISTDLGSAQHTSRWLEPFLRWLDPQVSARTLERVHGLVRKGGHAVGYAVLALLTLRALRASAQTRPGVWSARFAGWALLIAAGYAATDEFHQSFIPSRGASVRDVMIDSLGASLGLLLAFLLFKFWRERSVDAK